MIMKLLQEVSNLNESLPSPNNVDGVYNVGNTTFDNVDGLGATPNNANVMYRGCVAWMKPNTFRKLALEADRADDAKNLEQKMRDGKAIGAPFLILDIEGEPEAPEAVKVKGHEGRARSDAFAAINGQIPMPVQFHFYGLRARDLTPEFFKFIEEHGIVVERGTQTVKPDAKMYYCNGKEIKV
jgi:hypothetical protein